ncbi:tryptophanyl-tRNA synthetase [Cystobasidium minutum MCA 4210]|uniref:tryptophanyl-tRNA synthetase n=1 Tax=Cystobasidium minutum MCA 4210 TaxID=1397322 RepID=UPI0034CEF755|eukprot:jgi/Rhomi1/211344/estExt_Genemark1.C_4_t30011
MHWQRCLSSATSAVRNSSKGKGRISDTRVIFSGIQPTGNYLGALKNWVKLQNEAGEKDEIYFAVVGLHAITLPQSPAKLRQESRDMMAALLAIGLDPNRCTIFRQEQVKQHAELAWYLNCLAPFGRLQRMTTWKSRLATMRNANSEDEVDESMLHLGLFAYPVLQAADVLLYDTTEVPVGEDQEQHIELTRDLAQYFNRQFQPDLFTIPRHVFTPQARVLNLRDPSSKMSKSNPDPKTRIMLTDTPAEMREKLRTAVTDSQQEITYNPTTRPGVSNLLDILSGVTSTQPEELARSYEGKSMKALKTSVADALEPVLSSFQSEFARLKADPGYLDAVECQGRQKAEVKAESTMQRVRRAVGLDYQQ